MGDAAVGVGLREEELLPLLNEPIEGKNKSRNSEKAVRFQMIQFIIMARLSPSRNREEEPEWSAEPRTRKGEMMNK